MRGAQRSRQGDEGGDWARWFAWIILMVWVCGGVQAQTGPRTFTLASGTGVFEDATARFEVNYTGMRYQRVSGAWQVSVTLRNVGPSPVSGRLLLAVVNATGTTGPRNADNGAGAPPDEPRFWDLSPFIEGPALASGSSTRPRGLTLGRQGDATPQWTTRVYVETSRPAAAPLASIVTLDAEGLPLPGVDVREISSAGTRIRRSDAGAGVATLGGAAGDHRWQFSKEGFLPVWRRATLSAEVTRLAGVRLTPRAFPGISIGATGGAFEIPEALRVTVPSFRGASVATATLTMLEGHALPYPLPTGWNPQRAWWFEVDRELSGPLGVQVRPRDTLPSGQGAVLVRLDTNALAWTALEPMAGHGGDWISTELPGPGAYALVVADSGPTAPPAVLVGQALRGRDSIVSLGDGATATGRVVPPVSLASTNAVEVTAWAELEVRSGGPMLPSGTQIPVRIREHYRLSDGSERRPPGYESWITIHRRPGETNATIAHALFPLRPLLLMNGAELAEAMIEARVEASSIFGGGVLGGTNTVFRRDGVVLRWKNRGAGEESPQVVDVMGLSGGIGANPLNGEVEASRGAGGPEDGLAMPDGYERVAAFEVAVGAIEGGGRLEFEFDPTPPDGEYVLGRVWYRGSLGGLEPLARVTVRAGVWTETESASPGIDRSGRYVLVKVPASQGQVEGVVRNAVNDPLSDLALYVEGTPWGVLSDRDGRYRILAPVGEGALVARDPLTSDRVRRAFRMPNALGLEGVDLSVGPSAPFIVAVAPANGATNVPLLAPVSVTFSKPVVLPPSGERAVTLLDPGMNPLAADVELQPGGGAIRVIPDEAFLEGTTYRLRVSTNVADATGLGLTGRFDFSFTTLTQVVARAAGAQLYSEAPDASGRTRVIGTPGMAPPRQAVLFVNDTTGETATLTSNADGSFTNVMGADVTDRLRIVFSQPDGSRTELPVGRQVFPDGSVALYSEGGRITNRTAGWTAVLDVPPGAVPGRTRFKLTPHPVGNIPALTSNTPPEFGEFFGALDVEVEGDAVRGRLRVEVEASTAGLTPPPGGTVADLTLAAVAFREVEESAEGVPRRIRAYEYQSLLLPVEGRPGGSARLASARQPHLLAPALYAMIDPNGGRLMLFGTPYYSKTEILGRTGSALFLGGMDMVPGTEIPLGGAVVRARARSQLNPKPFSLQPGELYVTSAQDGRFAFLVPEQGISGGHALNATHPAFPRQFATSAAGTRFNPDHPFGGGAVLFDRNRPPDEVPPSLSVTHEPSLPGAGETTWVRVEATDDSGHSTVSLELDRVEPSTVVVTLTAGVPGLWELECRGRAKVVLRARAVDTFGNSADRAHVILFGEAAPSPAPVNDPLGPRVVFSQPDAEAVGIDTLAPFSVWFSEWVALETVDDPGLYFTLTPSGGPPAARFGRDPREVHLRYPSLRSDTEYTLTVQGVRDLNGQVLDQDPATNSPPAEAYQMRFRTAPEVNGVLSGIGEGGGVVMRGAYAYVIDRAGSALHRYDISEPARPLLAGQKYLPGPPRAIALVPDYSFTLDFAVSGVPSQEPGPVRRSDLLVVAGRTLGAGAGYLRVFDLGQPFAGSAAIGAGILGLDETALFTRLAWSAPYLLLVENAAFAPQVHVLNLQGVLLGDAYRGLDEDVLRGLPEEARLGRDANGDGDFVDDGDQLPSVGRENVNFVVGEEDVLTLSPNRVGPEGWYQLVESGRFITDAVGDGRSGQAVVLTAPGRDVLVESALFPIRTNVLFRPATLRSYVIGASSPDTLVPPVVTNAYGLEFPGWYPKRALFVEAGLRRLLLVNLISLDNSSNSVRVIDASRADALHELNEIPLPVAEYGLLQGAERDGRGRVVLSTASATGEDLVFLDPGALLAPTPARGPHPAILGRVAGGGAGVTPFAVGANGVSAASLRARNVVRQTAPSVRLLPPGTNTLELVQTSDANGRIEALRALPEVLELPVAGQGTHAALPADNPVFQWYLMVEAPGGAGSVIRLAAVSLGADGELARGTNAALPSFLDDVSLRRLSDDPVAPGFGVYLSGPLVLVDDSIEGPELDRIRMSQRVLRAGAQLRVGIPESMRGNPVLGAYAGSGTLMPTPPPSAPPVRLGVSLARPVNVSNPVLTADERVVVRTEVDRINGRACPGGDWLVYEHNLDAEISIQVDGRPLTNVYDDTGRLITVFTNVPSAAGSHRILIDAARVPEPGEHSFEIVGTRFAGLAPDRTQRVSGRIEHEIEISHAFPIGHTVVHGVNLWDGHLAHSSLDAGFSGRKLSLEFNRSYSSSGNSSDGPLGAGWTHSYHIRLVHRLSCGVFTVIGGEGSGNSFTDPRPDASRAARYGPLLPSGVNSARLEFFSPQIGYHSTLVRDLDRASEAWFFTKEGVRYHFMVEGALSHSSQTLYTLREIREPNGNALRLDYLEGDADPTTLDRVTEIDPMGGLPKRGFRFEFATMAGKPRLTALRGFNDQGSPDLLGLEVRYRYDGAGNLTNVVRVGRNAEDTRSESYAYSASDGPLGHNLVEYADPNGSVTRYRYAAATATAGNYYVTGGALLPGLPPHEIVTNVTYVGTARPGFEATDSASWGFRYDFAGSRRFVAEPRATDGDGTVIPETEYMLNAYGATVRILAPLGHEMQMRWATDHLDGSVRDEAGNPVHDVLLTWRRDPEGQEQFFEFHDGRGNLTRERTVFSGSTKRSVTDSAGNAVAEIEKRYAYDAVFNQRTNVVDAEDRATEMVIDPANGNLLRTVDALGHVTRFEYFPNGDLQRRIDARGFVTEFLEYDLFGNARQVRDPLGNLTVSDFDERGRLLEMRDGFTRHARYAYDALDRRHLEEHLDDLSGVSGGPGSMAGTRYLPGGQVSATTNALGLVSVRHYDALNREVVSEQRDVSQAAGPPQTYTSRAGYDRAGNLIEEIDARGVSRRHAYDALNRRVRTTVAGPFGGPFNADGVVARLAYDRAGNLTNEVNLHGLSTAHAHDALYRVVETRLPVAGAVIATRHDREGNLVRTTDAKGNATLTEYDALHRPVRVTDVEGNVLEHAYDAANNRTNTHDRSSGLVTGIQYDAANREISRRVNGPGLPANGYTTTTEYEDGLHQVTVTNARGFRNRTRQDGLDRVVERIVDVDGLALTSRFTYDAGGNLRTVTDPQNGDVDVTHHYDQLGRRLQSIPVRTPDDLADVSETVTYDGAGQVVSTVDRRGFESRAFYDNLGRPTRQEIRETVSQGGAWLAVSVIERDDASRRVTETDARGFRTVVEADEFGRPRRVIDALGQAITRTFDAVNLLSEIDKRSQRTEFAYDRLNRLRSTTEFDGGGVARSGTAMEYLDGTRRRRETDRRGFHTTLELDALGRSILAERSGGDLAARYGADPLALERRVYDPNGNVVRVIDGDGRVTEHAYDGADRLTNTVVGAGSPVASSLARVLDAAGNVLEEKDGRQHGTSFDVRHQYDARYRRISTANALGQTTRFRYDAGNLLIAETDPLGGETRYEYDERGALLAVDERARGAVGDAGVTRFRYDAARNRVAQQDASGNLVTHGFDALGRRTNTWQHTLPGTLGAGGNRGDGFGGGAALSWGMAYDPNDNPRWIRDARGQEVVLAYDHLDRLTNRAYSNHAERTGAGVPADFQPLSFRYVHDANGNLVQCVESKQGPGGAITERTESSFDALDRPIRTRRFDHDDAAGRGLQFAYDVGGNRTHLVDPDGRVTAYAYDERNRLATVVLDPSGASPLSARYDWEADNLLRQIEYPGGTFSRRHYDAADRLLSVTNAHPSRAAVFSSFSYAYDANGNRTRQEEFVPVLSAAPETTTYQYDRLNRLILVRYGTSGVVSNTYAANGNRLTEAGVDPVSGNAVDRRYHYSQIPGRAATTYSGVNALTRIEDRINAGSTVDYEYDANLNQVARVQGTDRREFRFDVRDQMIAAGTRTGTVRFDYSHARLRVKQVPASGVETRYLLDQSAVLLEYSGAAQGHATQRKYDYGHALLAVGSGGTGTAFDRSFYLVDGLQSTANLVDAAGVATDHYRYDAWGRVRARSGASGNPRQFTGHYRDEATGLHYLGARYYDDEQARFLSQDPNTGTAQTPPSLHRYLYAYSNPLRFTDPTGFESQSADPADKFIQESRALLKELDAKMRSDIAAQGADAVTKFEAGQRAEIELRRMGEERQRMLQEAGLSEADLRNPVMADRAKWGAALLRRDLGNWVAEGDGGIGRALVATAVETVATVALGGLELGAGAGTVAGKLDVGAEVTTGEWIAAGADVLSVAGGASTIGKIGVSALGRRAAGAATARASRGVVIAEARRSVGRESAQATRMVDNVPRRLAADRQVQSMSRQLDSARPFRSGPGRAESGFDLASRSGGSGGRHALGPNGTQILHQDFLEVAHRARRDIAPIHELLSSGQIRKVRGHPDFMDGSLGRYSPRTPDVVYVHRDLRGAEEVHTTYHELTHAFGRSRRGGRHATPLERMTEEFFAEIRGVQGELVYGGGHGSKSATRNLLEREGYTGLKASIYERYGRQFNHEAMDGGGALIFESDLEAALTLRGIVLK